MGAEDTRVPVLALAGNPNVGKSTLFNCLTGRRQHTGNWPGKTVEAASGLWRASFGTVRLVDLPGTYTLTGGSPEEDAAAAVISSGELDGVLLVCDATCLSRSLILSIQILSMGAPCILCLNLMDEAERAGIEIDREGLESRMGIPVAPISAGRRQGFPELERQVARLLEGQGQCCSLQPDILPTHLAARRAEKLVRETVSLRADAPRREHLLDRLMSRRLTAWPLMLLLLALVLWVTIAGANVPSQWLNDVLLGFEPALLRLFTWAPDWVGGILIQGCYRVSAWVVSVMLPPMAIFFPLFTLLEEWGLLPRVAFLMDHAFCRCGGCGRQALTLCMGFGCNAVGVSGCKIIQSPRERLVAVLTNCFVPCNGRFPILVAIITLFFAAGQGGIFAQLKGAALLTAVLLFGIGMSLAVSKLLSVTLLRGESSGFIMELPPLRRPQFGSVIMESLVNRTLFVLGRAVLAAAPMGAVIWVLGNVHVGGGSLLSAGTEFLDPFAQLLGLDGVILAAFLLGWPANEIVIPIMLMAYLSAGTLTDYAGLDALFALLQDNGWTVCTALCTMLFTLMHWPCAATCLTIRKETGSTKWMLLAIALPALCGIVVCALVNGLFCLLF